MSLRQQQQQQQQQPPPPRSLVVNDEEDYYYEKGNKKPTRNTTSNDKDKKRAIAFLLLLVLLIIAFDVRNTSSFVVVGKNDPSAGKSTTSVTTNESEEKDDNDDENYYYFLLIHIGRTGGTSIREKTAISCWDVQDDNHYTQDCLQQYGHGPVGLASLTSKVLHMDGINPNDYDIVEKAAAFVVTIRNPLERVLSAYRVSHPDWTQNQPQHAQAYFLFTTCFPSPLNIENFCQAILPNYNVPHFSKQQKLSVQQKCDCRALARRTVLGQEADLPLLHFHYQYYATATYQKYPTKPLYAIRLENQKHDYDTINKLVSRGNNYDWSSSSSSSSSWKDEKITPQSQELLEQLSPEATKKLCCVLHQEIEVYLDLFDKAINLSAEDKTLASNQLRQQCGLKDDNSWSKWKTSCLQRFTEPAWSKCVSSQQQSTT